MATYHDVDTILEAFHQLERGRSMTRIKAAAKRLRSFDPANEMLPELDAKIETVGQFAAGVVSSRPQHDRHDTA